MSEKIQSIVDEAKAILEAEEIERALHHTKNLLKRRGELEAEIKDIDRGLEAISHSDFSDVPKYTSGTLAASSTCSMDFARSFNGSSNHSRIG